MKELYPVTAGLGFHGCMAMFLFTKALPYFVKLGDKLTLKEGWLDGLSRPYCRKLTVIHLPCGPHSRSMWIPGLSSVIKRCANNHLSLHNGYLNVSFPVVQKTSLANVYYQYLPIETQTTQVIKNFLVATLEKEKAVVEINLTVIVLNSLDPKYHHLNV